MKRLTNNELARYAQLSGNTVKETRSVYNEIQIEQRRIYERAWRQIGAQISFRYYGTK